MSADWKDDDQVTMPEIARRLGLKLSTVHSYRYRPATGFPFPVPDGKHDGRTPWWWWKTIRSWRRPGQGARTDLPRTETPAE